MKESSSVVQHYGDTSLTARISDALKQAGLGDDNLDWKDLTPLDQFHVRGLAATEELAAGMHILPGATILDVGSGLGGPSRFLAAKYGAQVTGIDLTPPFVEAASMLSERTGLAARTTYRVADALDLPFSDSSFDHAWTQHVAMNIGDRARLYDEIFRVVKPGGSLGIYDIVAGNGEPLIFPVPWAREPDASFLLTPDAMRDALVNSGFGIASWFDATEDANAWVEKQRVSRNTGAAPHTLGLHMVTSPDFPMMMANLGRNLIEGRVRLVQVIAAKGHG